MSKLFKSRILLLILLLSASFHVSYGQGFVQIGTGTDSNTTTTFPAPFGNANWGVKHQILYRATDLSTSGLPVNSYINSLGFKVMALNSSAALQGWTMKVYTTTLTNPLAFTWVNSNLVAVSAPMTLQCDTGWNQVPLTTPFVWNGSDNIIIETCFNNASTSTNQSVLRQKNMSGATFVRVNRANNTTICSDTSSNFSWTNQRPIVRMGYNNVACSGVPVAGTATVSDANPCVNDIVQLSLNGINTNIGQTIQWQESTTSNGPWTNVTGANNYNYYFTATASKFYRAEIKCSTNTVYTNVLSVTVLQYLTPGTYTINNTLPTGGTNFNSFAAFSAAAQNAISGAIVVNVNPGNYNERFYLNNICGTSQYNTITINGNGANLIYTSTNANDRGVVTFDGTDYVTINNLNIKAYSTSSSNYAWGVLFTNNADKNTINNCTITLDSNATSNNYIGVVASATKGNLFAGSSFCDYNTITNTTINGGQYGFALIGGASPNQIQNWTITNNTIKNSGASAIYCTGNIFNVITDNDIHRLGRTSLNNFTAISFTDFNYGVKVQRNKIHDISTANLNANFDFFGIYFINSEGIVSIPASRSEVSNNIMYNLNGTGNHTYFYDYASAFVGFYYNTVATGNNSTLANGTTIGYFQHISNNDQYIWFRNNNLSINRNSDNVKVPIYLSAGQLKLLSNYNNLYVGGAGYNYNGFYLTSYYKTIFEWQTYSGRDTNSFAMNPYMLTPNTPNLIPTHYQLNNICLPITGITTDYTGATRDVSSPDVGAFEFNITACSGTPNAGKAVCDYSLACPNGTLTLTLDSFSIPSLTFAQNIFWQTKPTTSSTWTTISSSNPTFYYSYYNTTMPTVSTDYRALVKCGTITNYSTPVTVGVQPWYMCYCSPLTGTTLHSVYSNIINNVAISGTTLNSSTINGQYNFGHSRMNPNVINRTATLAKQNPYTITVNFGGPQYYAGVWIDYDKNQIFDASEYTQLDTLPGNMSSGTITIPASTTIGPTGMRIRAFFNTPGAANAACSSVSNGQETEDYIISVWYPLSVKLEHISAVNDGDRNRVDWNTVSEDAGDYFIVEKSIDGTEYESMGRVNARGIASTYFIHDTHPHLGLNYYRLKVVSLDGNIAYSKVVTVYNNTSKDFSISAFPNPVQQTLSISINGNIGNNATIEVVDIYGKVLMQQTVQSANDQIDCSSLPNGLYLLRYSDDTNNRVLKINKQ